jgi:glycosyltransferase involved in cell wall biosynthesis
MEKPIVSVIIPNYNYATFLPQRITSILGQSFTDFELILLDDASSDQSVEILRHYEREDTRIKTVVINECNSGSPFKQWKKGLELANGKYIWIAESDDYANPSFLEKTVALLEKYPKAVYCSTYSYLVDEEGRILHKDMDHWDEKRLNSTANYTCVEGVDYVVNQMYWKNHIYNASGVLFRKDVFLKLPNDEWASMRYCGDWFFWTMMALQGDILEIHERLNYFRQHPVSVTASSKRDESAYIECMRECMYITWTIEHFSPINLYKRWFCYGNYYKLFKREKLSRTSRETLFSDLKKMCKMPFLAYCTMKINRVLMKLAAFSCIRKK